MESKMATITFRRKLFSKKEEEDVQFNKGDKINYKRDYGLMRRNGYRAKRERERLEGDSKKNAKSAAIEGVIGGGGAGAIVGAGLGALSGKKKGALKGAAIGSLVGASSTGIGAGVGSLIGTGIRHKKEGKSKEYKKAWEKQRDLFAVSQGEMTERDFVKKWGGKINGKEVKGTENKNK